MLQTNRIVVGLTLLLLIGGISACSNEASTKNVEILGEPSTVAYLGVEYSYNFGSAGGDNLHNYSLSLHPDWLSLEAIENTARFGVVARGIPGITGGRKGLADLATSKNITLSVTDNGRFGSYSWPIEVKENTVGVTAPAVVEEGKATEVDEQNQSTGGECQLPDMSVRTITVDNVDYKLYPIILDVNLLRPSVEVVKVRYSFSTAYKDDNPEGEQSRQNREHARANHDYIIDYDNVNAENSKFYNALRNPDELYEPGVVTFEPGVTKCFIRAYVNEDLVAEATEVFSVNLDEIIQGIASIGTQENDFVQIRDNEPTVSFEETGPFSMSEGSTRTFVASLDKIPGFKENIGGSPTPVSFDVIVNFLRLKSSEKANVGDFVFYTWVEADRVVEDTIDEATGCLRWGEEPIPTASSELLSLNFTGDQTKREFRVCLLNDGDNDIGKDDELVFGFRDDFGTISARPSLNTLSILINEWLNEVVVASGDEVVLDSIIDADGNLVLLGSSAAEGGIPFLRFFNRFGISTKPDITLLPMAGVSRPIGLAYFEAVNSDKEALADNDKTNDKIYSVSVLLETDKGIGDGFSGKDAYLATYSRVSNVQEYSLEWDVQIGSSSDDIPASLAIAGGNFYIAGTTFGDWSRAIVEGENDIWQDQVHKGNGDLFVAKVSYSEGSVLNDWTNVIGTDSAEKAVSLIATTGQVSVVGQTEGILGDFSFGGVDGVLVTADVRNSTVGVINQFGSARDDQVTTLLRNGSLWVSVASDQEIFDSMDSLQEKLDAGSAPEDFDSIVTSHVRFGVEMNIVSKSLKVASIDNGLDFVNSAVAGDGANYLAGSTTGTLLNESEDELNIGRSNLGGSDAFVMKTNFKRQEDTDESIAWIYQFGSSADDFSVDVELENTAKLSIVWREGFDFKASKLSTEGVKLVH